MNQALQEQLSTITHAPLQALGAILLQIKFRWCPVGWTDWTLRYTKGQHAFFKLLAQAPVKAERELSYWPTPVASRYELVHPPRNTTNQILLSNALAMEDPRLEGQAINPRWVEIAMGFPEGWTDLRDGSTGVELLERKRIA